MSSGSTHLGDRGDYGYYDKHDKNRQDFSNVGISGNKSKAIDTHELLKKELYIQTGMPITPGGIVPISAGGSETESFLGSNDQYGIVDRYFYLDSTNKDSSSRLESGEISFSIQLLNQQKPIDNIIEMEIGDLFIPEVVKPANFPEFYFFRRIYIAIQEMTSQAIFAENGQTRFHFSRKTSPAGISNEITDIGFDKFIFTQPFRDVTTATFSFKTSGFPTFRPIVFNQDVFDFTAVPTVAGGVFGGATITTSIPHGLTVGDDISIFITDFSSGIGSIDNNIGSPNYKDGHLMRVIDATTLEFRDAATVGFDFTTLGVATPGRLLVGFRRIAFTMRFRSITPRITNQIIPV